MKTIKSLSELIDVLAMLDVSNDDLALIKYYINFSDAYELLPSEQKVVLNDINIIINKYL